METVPVIGRQSVSAVNGSPSRAYYFDCRGARSGAVIGVLVKFGLQ